MKLPTTLGDFTPQARAYAAARPTYPAVLADELIRHAGVRPGDAVADLAAGTGIFTRLLSGRGLRITAVDPNDAMRAQAPTLPNVTWEKGTFEESGLPDGAQHWVVAAQAFHWADPARALPEMHRVLRPDRCFTVLWNNRQTQASPLLTWTLETIVRHVPEFHDDYRGGYDKDWGMVLTATGDFTGAVVHEANHVVSMTCQRYLDLWRSHNRLNTTAGPERMAALLGDIEDYLTQEGMPEVEVPYRCKAWSVRRS
jgi:ubiquinone/menaquinone biosynthesis C-methylase UbiE